MSPLGPTLLEIGSAWWDLLAPFGLLLAAFGAIGAALIWTLRLRAVAVVATLVGAGLAWQQLSLVDDAFITLRYADHWTRGLGPVWNAGERVEGITNFGWMAILALAHVATGGPLEHLALIACGLAYVGLVAATAALEGALDPERRVVPLATALLAVQYVITSYASSGLETEAAAALVVAGAVVLHRRDDPAGVAIAAALFATAGLLRMDHLIAWGLGLGWVALRGRDRDALVAYVSTILPWVGVHTWKLWFYGSILPNTWYAKSAGGWYPSQGLIYAAEFLGASHLWLAVVPALAWPFVATGRERRLAGFATAFVVAWQLYVLKIGGDFMTGRFYVPVVPFLLVGAVRTAAALRDPRAALAVVALVGATLRGGSLLPPYTIRWGLNDEGTAYRVRQLRPIVVEHYSFDDGQALHRSLTARGIRPVLATSGIGMVGYYSQLDVVDVLGLTDPVIGRRPIATRGRPGHEKAPPPGYLYERGVDLVRHVSADPLLADLARVQLGDVTPRWSIHSYDDELWEQVAAEAPEVRFQRFAPFVRARVLPMLEESRRADAERILEALDAYYWRRNGPDGLRARVVREVGAAPP